MRIYLDVSCLNRPFDDQRQARVHMESEAILVILSRFESGVWAHWSSEMATIEVQAISDESRRCRVAELLPVKDNILPLDEALLRRAGVLNRFILSTADATHLAAAEAIQVDVFLTCDDALLRRAAKFKRKLRVRVANPFAWLKEHFDASNS